MRLTLVAACGLLAAPGHAQEVKPLLDLRLRWEQVDQHGMAREASAVTLRARAGAELAAGDWTLLAEGEGTVAPLERFDSGLNRRAAYPLVADPQNLELNRLQLHYRGLDRTRITLGRQRINLDDQRFVGAAGWRQNEQTFDALRIEYGATDGLRADLAFAWSVRTIWGIDGAGARQQAVGGRNLFASLGHPTPLGALSGFAVIVDSDERAVQGFRLSSQTFGLRLAGSRALSPGARIAYAFGHARQSDHRRNPNDYRAAYWLADVGVELGRARFGLGHERLGADRGAPLTSFQTPLATLHKFQGWADKFLVTPPDGVRDWWGSAGYGFKRLAGLDSLGATLAFHRFDSDRRVRRYGDEWDAMLSARKGRWTATAKVAAYRARNFAADTRKLWLQLEWQY